MTPHQEYNLQWMCRPGQEVMGPAYRTAAGMMLCMFFAVRPRHR